MVFAATEGIGQLIVMALLFVGWVIKEVNENAKRKRAAGEQGQKPARRSRTREQEQKPTTPPAPTTQPQEAVPLYDDVVYGSQPLKHLPLAAAQVQAPETPGRQKKRARPVPVEAGRTSDYRATEISESGGLIFSRGHIETTTASTATQRRRRAQRRLGIAQVRGSLRQKTRTAVLWAEVLGPCRALRGPHRFTRRTR